MKVMVEVEVEGIAEQILKQLAESEDLIKVIIKVIRCKDCKLRRTSDCPWWDDTYPEYETEDYWFCADGKRR